MLAAINLMLVALSSIISVGHTQQTLNSLNETGGIFVLRKCISKDIWMNGRMDGFVHIKNR